MSAYYNENDPFAAAWLRNLIGAGLIAPGDVDERSITDVQADDLGGYTQCHFFAGVGGWSIALRQAGWPDDRSVWTGSCPCQPFSAAGAGKTFSDERHLWPVWFSLVAQRGPSTIFGEQVEAAVGWGWLDAVFADLEKEGYSCGASILPACSVGAPHIRNRLWFVADSYGSRERGRFGEKGKPPREDERKVEGRQRERIRPLNGGIGTVVGMADAERSGRQQQPMERRTGSKPSSLGEKQLLELGDHGTSPVAGFWADAGWIPCADGKARPVGPGSFPLGHGIRNRASKLRAYGNAIVPQVAAQFITAASEAIA